MAPYLVGASRATRAILHWPFSLCRPSTLSTSQSDQQAGEGEDRGAEYQDTPTKTQKEKSTNAEPTNGLRDRRSWAPRRTKQCNLSLAPVCPTSPCRILNADATSRCRDPSGASFHGATRTRASLSRRRPPCKAIYAVARRGRSKQDSPLHGSLVLQSLGRPEIDKRKREKMGKRGGEEGQAESQEGAVCQLPGVSAAGCCVLPSAFEKAPRTLCWRRGATLRLAKRASASRLPALILSITLCARGNVACQSASWFCTVSVTIRDTHGVADEDGQRAGREEEEGERSVQTGRTIRHRQT